jgi:hypothetical protein
MYEMCYNSTTINMATMRILGVIFVGTMSMQNARVRRMHVATVFSGKDDSVPVVFRY